MKIVNLDNKSMTRDKNRRNSMKIMKPQEKTIKTNENSINLMKFDENRMETIEKQ
jgi:hypothetical protein